jgi:hypothetical protein
MDRAIASLTGTNHSRDNSASRSRDFGLPSRAATGTKPYALNQRHRSQVKRNLSGGNDLLDHNSRLRPTGDDDVVARRLCAFAHLRAAFAKRRRDRVSEPLHAGLRLSTRRLARAPVRDNLIRDLLAFVEVLHPGALAGADVNEHVGSTVCRLDEAEGFVALNYFTVAVAIAISSCGGCCSAAG